MGVGVTPTTKTFETNMPVGMEGQELGSHKADSHLTTLPGWEHPVHPNTSWYTTISLVVQRPPGRQRHPECDRGLGFPVFHFDAVAARKTRRQAAASKAQVRDARCTQTGQASETVSLHHEVPENQAAPLGSQT